MKDFSAILNLKIWFCRKKINRKGFKMKLMGLNLNLQMLKKSWKMQEQQRMRREKGCKRPDVKLNSTKIKPQNGKEFRIKLNHNSKHARRDKERRMKS